MWTPDSCNTHGSGAISYTPAPLFSSRSNVGHSFEILFKCYSSLNDWFYGHFHLNSRCDQGNKTVNYVWMHASSVSREEETNKGVVLWWLIGGAQTGVRLQKYWYWSVLFDPPAINYIKDFVQSWDGNRKVIFAGPFFSLPFPLSWWHSASCISSIWMFPSKKRTEKNVKVMLLQASLNMLHLFIYLFSFHYVVF